MEGKKRRWNADQKEDDVLFKMQEEKEKRRLCKKFVNLVNLRKAEKKVERAREEKNMVRKREAKMRCKKTIVYNRSSHELSKEMMSVLQLGLNFVPTPNKVSCIDIMVSTEETCAGTIKKNQDDDCGDEEEEKRIQDARKEIIRDKVKNEVSELMKRGCMKIKDNLTRAEGKALDDLRKNEDITIVKADKGNAVVVFDKSEYVRKVKIPFTGDDYREVKGKTRAQVISQRKKAIDKMVSLIEQHYEWQGKMFSML